MLAFEQSFNVLQGVKNWLNAVLREEFHRGLLKGVSNTSEGPMRLFLASRNVLHDGSLKRKHRLVDEQARRVQAEGWGLISCAQDVMGFMNDIGKKLARG